MGMEHEVIINRLSEALCPASSGRGGVNKLAEMLERPQNTVSRWKRFGIPPNVWPRLIKIGASIGVHLSANDFIRLDEENIPLPPAGRNCPEVENRQ
jgi:hypothetical protein